MKTSLIRTTAIAVLISGAIFMIHKNQKDSSLSNLVLENIEALAQDDENNQKNIYRYVVEPTSPPCYIYVGGAYAKGKEVTCWSGTDHPVCVKCVL